MIVLNDLGKAQNSNLNGWSKMAVDCYKIGCRCSYCSVPQLFEQNVRCTMKVYVLELVKKFGVPKECKNQPMNTKVI